MEWQIFYICLSKHDWHDITAPVGPGVGGVHVGELHQGRDDNV